jgi:hypothetical protein
VRGFSKTAIALHTLLCFVFVVIKCKSLLDLKNYLIFLLELAHVFIYFWKREVSYNDIMHVFSGGQEWEPKARSRDCYISSCYFGNNSHDAQLLDAHVWAESIFLSEAISIEDKC